MSNFEFYLKKAGDFHGHVCAGIALGTRMALTAMKGLGMEPGVKNKNLIVYTEIDRCMTDAVQVVTGCTPGHRSLKYIDYGKFAATFVDLNTGKALRASIKESFDSSGPVEEVARTIALTPDRDLVILQEVKVDIPETDLPGSPRKKSYCLICGERVMDGREILRNGKVLCRACANGKYYTEIKTGSTEVEDRLSRH
ncbi:MAG: FmdE family protein [Dehalococcoidales bacterium]|nr:FmdE family protein [Dehalococcoidales bacterium]